MTKSTKPFGPWSEGETLSFLDSAVRADKDTAGLRYDLDSAAEALAKRSFDASDMWSELEATR